jgi:hypothetical protein
MEDIEINDSLVLAIISYYLGDISQDQAQELLVWVGHSLENLLYFQRIKEVWNVSGLLNDQEFDTEKMLFFINNKLR